MCKFLSLSHIAKIYIILIKQTIFSKKVKKKGDQVSDLLYPKLTDLGYDFRIGNRNTTATIFNFVAV